MSRGVTSHCDICRLPRQVQVILRSSASTDRTARRFITGD